MFLFIICFMKLLSIANLLHLQYKWQTIAQLKIGKRKRMQYCKNFISLKIIFLFSAMNPSKRFLFKFGCTCHQSRKTCFLLPLKQNPPENPTGFHSAYINFKNSARRYLWSGVSFSTIFKSSSEVTTRSSCSLSSKKSFMPTPSA